MNQQQIHQYIRQFFKESQCDVFEENDDRLSVQLTIDMDLKLA